MSESGKNKSVYISSTKVPGNIPWKEFPVKSNEKPVVTSSCQSIMMLQELPSLTNNLYQSNYN